MQDVPHRPTLPPFRIDLQTFGTQMSVGMTALEDDETGGAPIVSYNLQIDSDGGGSGPWTNVIGEDGNYSIALTTIINNLTGGTTYYFRYAARNAHGWGEYSNVSLILMATKPDKIASSLTRTQNVGIDVVISWDPTPNDRDSVVISYRVQIRQKNGLFS